MMINNLNILIVEDSEIDAELIVHELKKSGFSFYSERVETYESMEAALKEKEWQVILSDNIMPRFNSLEALKLKMEMKPELPFIIVSDYISDDIVFEAMKNGCREYVMKSSLKNLAKVIRRELERA